MGLRSDMETSSAHASTDYSMERHPFCQASASRLRWTDVTFWRDSLRGETLYVQSASFVSVVGFGIWLGGDAKSDMHVVGTQQGSFTTRTIRNLPPSERHDIQLLLAMRGTPWSMRTGRYDDEPDEIAQQPAGHEAASARSNNKPHERQDEQAPEKEQRIGRETMIEMWSAQYSARTWAQLRKTWDKDCGEQLNLADAEAGMKRGKQLMEKLVEKRYSELTCRKMPSYGQEGVVSQREGRESSESMRDCTPGWAGSAIECSSRWYTFRSSKDSDR